MRAQNTELDSADPETVLRSVTDKTCHKLRLNKIPKDVRISDTAPDDEPEKVENVVRQLSKITDTEQHILHRVLSSLSEIYELSANYNSILSQTINHDEWSRLKKCTPGHSMPNNPIRCACRHNYARQCSYKK